jgi:hypothetical protein
MDENRRKSAKCSQQPGFGIPFRDESATVRRDELFKRTVIVEVVGTGLYLPRSLLGVGHCLVTLPDLLYQLPVLE